MELSSFAKKRLEFAPQYPSVLDEPCLLWKIYQKAKAPLQEVFPHLADLPILEISEDRKSFSPMTKNGAVLFSGGQASGGHNVIAGFYDGLKQASVSSRIFGILDGPQGLLDGKGLWLDEQLLAAYRNQGGFDLLGSSRTKIEKEEDQEKARIFLEKNNIGSLLIIGGDDSHTNAALLAEYFLKKGSSITVNAAPKTIDGDLRHPCIPISFGYDTATRVYKDIVGNLARDALSAKKYTYFIRLMGRSASHITLDVALGVQPNVVLISEEIASRGSTLGDIAREIAAVIKERSEAGKNYGVILLPEGIIEAISDINVLVHEIGGLNKDNAPKELSDPAKKTLSTLPEDFQKQILYEKDPHGNVEVSKIESERLLIKMVSDILPKNIPFRPVPFFFGYEGRCAFPSNFDCCFAYGLGKVAAHMAVSGLSGYTASFIHLEKPPKEWKPLAVPIASMVDNEIRGGKTKAVVKKTLVDLEGPLFKEFLEKRASWLIDDKYRQPGPQQFDELQPPVF